MANSIPKSYKIFLTGPFNTSMQFDYSQLSNNYDAMRRSLYKAATSETNENFIFYVERFKDEPELLTQWLELGKKKRKNLIFSDPQGQTYRDISIISAYSTQNINPNLELFKKIEDYFATKPVMKDIEFKFHEMGIGVFSGTIEMDLKQSLTFRDNEYKEFTKILRDSFSLSEELQKLTHSIDQKLSSAFENIIKGKKSNENIIDLKKIYPDEPTAKVLWGHAVAIMQAEYEGILPFGHNTCELLVVSHPDGMIDMNNLSAGFIHIGWGMSLAVNIKPKEMINLRSTMEQLEYYWRSAQILNDLIMKYLEKYSNVKKLSLTKIKKSLNEIEKLTIESELFYSYHMDYLKMLSPLSHFLYQETAKSWRINQMFDFFDNKKDSLSKLHEQGEARIKENIDSKRDKMSNRLNILLSILALLTLFSWAADSLGFLDATLSLLPSLKNYLIGGKLFVVIITPLMVIGIFVLFFKLTKAMKDIEE